MNSYQKTSKDSAAADMLDPAALFKFSYGLFVLSTRCTGKDSGCIINTAIQLSSSPQRISVAVNKANATHDEILKSGIFNVSVLSTDVTFDTFRHFGFQSSRDVNKFEGLENACRSANGVFYLTEIANAFFSGKVVETIDSGSHTLFIADITEMRVLSAAPSITYAYYFEHVKPKPPVKTAGEDDSKKKKGFICEICGYIYEGDELPADFICPICKHPASDFRPL